MGKFCDHYMVRRKNLHGYQTQRAKTIIDFNKNARPRLVKEPLWFHFKKQTNKRPTPNGWVLPNDTKDTEVLSLGEEEQQLYVEYMGRYFDKENPYHPAKIRLFDAELEKRIKEFDKVLEQRKKQMAAFPSDKL